MTQPEVLRDLLSAVAQGQVSPETAYTKLKNLDYEALDEFAKIDHHRALRTGFPEVVWGPGKTVDQLKTAAIGNRLIQGIFRGTMLGIWIATCIKLQAVYLLSDGTNILHWLVRDASFAMSIVEEAKG